MRRYENVASMHELAGWVSAQKAAELLNVDLSTIRRMVTQQQLTARRWGGHALMIERASVDTYQRERRPRGRPKQLPLEQSTN